MLHDHQKHQCVAQYSTGCNFARGPVCNAMVRLLEPGSALTGVGMSTVRLLATIRREFQEHPGIVVTLPQAQSRWSLEKGHCTKALEALVAEGFLQRVGDVYLWANAPAPHFRIRAQIGVSLIH